jgi:uncharacterized membrane protein YsdA (DUF1294 family)
VQQAARVADFAAFFLMGIDKRKARRRGWRISESALFFWALVGGAPGGLAGMLLFSHKTRKAMFIFGFAALTALWIFLWVAVF